MMSADDSFRVGCEHTHSGVAELLNVLHSETLHFLEADDEITEHWNTKESCWVIVGTFSIYAGLLVSLADDSSISVDISH